MKTGRNDLCPCGSGKKYKHCCLLDASAIPEESPALSAQRKAHAYLADRFRNQQREAIAEGFFGQFDDPEELREALEDLDEGHERMLAINLNDWVLCDARYERRGEWKRGIEWVLADERLRLSNAERAYLRELEHAPLRLHEITAVERGRGFCLRDLHDASAIARFVHEDSGTRNASEGVVLGVRVIEDPDRTLRISGVVYTFARTTALTILEEIHEVLYPIDASPPITAPIPLNDELIADVIRFHWLEAVLDPPPPANLVTRSGESLLLIEDEYDVLDSVALQAALAAEDDVEGDAEQGWVRVLRTSDDEDDPAQILSSINPGSIEADETAGAVVLFHRSASAAEHGREWFSRIAGDAVQHRARQTTDPVELLAKRNASGQPLKSEPPAGITPEEYSALIAQALHSTYADWCDAPLPILNDTSPRGLIATREGRERVRFLLRTYELAEKQMAAQQDRPPVPYDFLWQELRLERQEPAV